MTSRFSFSPPPQGQLVPSPDDAKRRMWQIGAIGHEGMKSTMAEYLMEILKEMGYEEAVAVWARTER